MSRFLATVLASAPVLISTRSWLGAEELRSQEDFYGLGSVENQLPLHHSLQLLQLSVFVMMHWATDAQRNASAPFFRRAHSKAKTSNLSASHHRAGLST